MAIEIASQLQAFGLTDIILWMITFAVVYGVLSQVGEGGIPKQKGSRAIIAIVIAFMVLFAAPAQLSATIGKISSSLLLIILGLLSLIVFIEAAGVKAHVGEKYKGTHLPGGKEVSIFEAYGKYFGAALILIAVMIFVAAGGLNMVGLGGLNLGFGNIDMLGAGFFILIVLAIVWMIAESGGDKNSQ